MIGIDSIKEHNETVSRELLEDINKQLRNRIKLEARFEELCRELGQTRQVQEQLRDSQNPWGTLVPFKKRDQARELKKKLTQLEQDYRDIQNQLAVCEDTLQELMEKYMRNNSESFRNVLDLLKFYRPDRVEPITEQMSKFYRETYELHRLLSKDYQEKAQGRSDETRLAYDKAAAAGRELDYLVGVFNKLDANYTFAAEGSGFLSISIPRMERIRYEDYINSTRDMDTGMAIKEIGNLLQTIHTLHEISIPKAQKQLEDALDEFVNRITSIIRNEWMRRLVQVRNGSSQPATEKRPQRLGSIQDGDHDPSRFPVAV